MRQARLLGHMMYGDRHSQHPTSTNWSPQGMCRVSILPFTFHSSSAVWILGYICSFVMFSSGSFQDESSFYIHQYTQIHSICRLWNRVSEVMRAVNFKAGAEWSLRAGKSPRRKQAQALGIKYGVVIPRDRVWLYSEGGLWGKTGSQFKELMPGRSYRRNLSMWE